MRAGSEAAWKDAWRTAVRDRGREHTAALAGVLQRAERLQARTAEAALPLLLAEYEIELQRVLARLSWLEQDAGAIPGGARKRHPDPAGWYRIPTHAPEDEVEDEPEEDGVHEPVRSRMK
jgi:hypothetical protein